MATRAPVLVLVLCSILLAPVALATSGWLGSCDQRFTNPCAYPLVTDIVNKLYADVQSQSNFSAILHAIQYASDYKAEVNFFATAISGEKRVADGNGDTGIPVAPDFMSALQRVGQTPTWIYLPGTEIGCFFKFTSGGNQYFLGAHYGAEAGLDPIVPCTSAFNYLCTIHNAQVVLGDAVAMIVGAESSSALDSVYAGFRAAPMLGDFSVVVADWASGNVIASGNSQFSSTIDLNKFKAVPPGIAELTDSQTAAFVQVMIPGADLFVGVFYTSNYAKTIGGPTEQCLANETTLCAYKQLSNVLGNALHDLLTQNNVQGIFTLLSTDTSGTYIFPKPQVGSPSPLSFFTVVHDTATAIRVAHLDSSLRGQEENLNVYNLLQDASMQPGGDWLTFVSASGETRMGYQIIVRRSDGTNYLVGSSIAPNLFASMPCNGHAVVEDTNPNDQLIDCNYRNAESMIGRALFAVYQTSDDPDALRGAFWNISFDPNYLIEKNAADPDSDGFYAFVTDWDSGLRFAHGDESLVGTFVDPTLQTQLQAAANVAPYGNATLYRRGDQLKLSWCLRVQHAGRTMLLGSGFGIDDPNAPSRSSGSSKHSSKTTVFIVVIVLLLLLLVGLVAYIVYLKKYGGVGGGGARDSPLLM